MIIYKITNKINGKYYIGQTIHSLKNRWKSHKADMNRFDYALQRALKKYGVENFTINEIDKGDNQEELNKKECFWIEYHNSMTPFGYNIRNGGANGKLSEETKQKISRSKMGSGLGKIPWNKGIRSSEETKQKISISLSGNKHPMFGKKHSKETRRKMGIGKRKAIVVDDFVCFLSLTYAADFFKTSKENIHYRMRQSSGKYKRWNYID